VVCFPFGSGSANPVLGWMVIARDFKKTSGLPLGSRGGIEERYPKEFTAIDVYNEVVRLASESKNDLLLVSYAQKIVALQKQFKSSPLSPMIEFNYAEALKRLGKDKEALEVILGIAQNTLEPKDKIRLFYNAGELSLKLKEDEKAKAYFTQCVDVNESSSWKSICEENLKLF